MFEQTIAPDIDETQYPNFIGDCECYSEWYRYKDYYMQAEYIDNVIWLSIINLGKPYNILSQVSELCHRLAKNSIIGFTYKTEYKSKSLINKLIKSFEIIDYGKIEEYTYYILKEKLDVKNN
jgi:hypothetical protein